MCKTLAPFNLTWAKRTALHHSGTTGTVRPEICLFTFVRCHSVGLSFFLFRKTSFFFSFLFSPRNFWEAVNAHQMQHCFFFIWGTIVWGFCAKDRFRFISTAAQLRPPSSSAARSKIGGSTDYCILLSSVAQHFAWKHYWSLQAHL